MNETSSKVFLGSSFRGGGDGSPYFSGDVVTDGTFTGSPATNPTNNLAGHLYGGNALSSLNSAPATAHPGGLLGQVTILDGVLPLGITFDPADPTTIPQAIRFAQHNPGQGFEASDVIRRRQIKNYTYTQASHHYPMAWSFDVVGLTPINATTNGTLATGDTLSVRFTQFGNPHYPDFPFLGTEVLVQEDTSTAAGVGAFTLRLAQHAEALLSGLPPRNRFYHTYVTVGVGGNLVPAFTAPAANYTHVVFVAGQENRLWHDLFQNLSQNFRPFAVHVTPGLTLEETDLWTIAVNPTYEPFARGRIQRAGPTPTVWTGNTYDVSVATTFSTLPAQIGSGLIRQVYDSVQGYHEGRRGVNHRHFVYAPEAHLPHFEYNVNLPATYLTGIFDCHVIEYYETHFSAGFSPSTTDFGKRLVLWIDNRAQTTVAATAVGGGTAAALEVGVGNVTAPSANDFIRSLIQAMR